MLPYFRERHFAGRGGALYSPLPLDEVAAQADTIGYEILTALGGRYRRVWRGGVAAR